ncbi:MAG TPA: ATP-binding protein [Polyangiaceae bacterium]|nr:ATP-binding protein [Polyangiaceae bacterium]
MNGLETSATSTSSRAEEVFQEHRQGVLARTDRLMAVLMVAQWLFGIVVALTLSPYGWEGRIKTPHVHVYAAVLLGGAISSLPVALALTRPGWLGTRLVVGVAQMLWSALLIHLTGGRIETHFHVFGSLAFLAFYRDWRVLLPATIVVAADHLVRQLFWPESVYGIANPEWWRFLEHAFWVVFEDTVLVIGCLEGVKEMRAISQRTAEVEALSNREKEKSAELDRALHKIQQSQEALVRAEKLAAVGQLAASVGHELRNPLAAVRNANTYITKKIAGQGVGANLTDPKIKQFLTVIDREVSVCTKIIADLLDFARERAPVIQPCPLRPLVDDAIAVLPESKTRIVNAVPEDLPVPSLDRDHFRQVLINLLQNAVEAIPTDRDGEVVIRAEASEGELWRIIISDNGSGIPEEIVGKIFEPLFTTKSKGTGLGLAIVAGMIKAHKGSIRVDTRAGEGTRFTIELPSQPVFNAA